MLTGWSESAGTFLGAGRLICRGLEGRRESLVGPAHWVLEGSKAERQSQHPERSWLSRTTDQGHRLPGYLWRHRQGRQSADKLQGGRASPSNLASWGDLEMTVPASQPPGWRDCWKSKIHSVPGRPGQAQLRVRREEEGPGAPPSATGSLSWRGGGIGEMLGPAVQVAGSWAGKLFG